MKKSLKFSKYEAIGNDYIVINPKDVVDGLHEGLLSAERVAKICDRHIGIGGDGILFGPQTDREPYQLTIYNSDGSTAEKSGNGLRIFSKYLFDNGYTESPNFKLQVLDTVIEGYRIDDSGNLFRLNMGIPNFTLPIIKNNETKPLSLLNEVVQFSEDIKLNVSIVSMGNPHCVVMDKGYSLEEIKQMGQLLETHPMFPNRTNVQFLKVIDSQTIAIHIWERGSGYTLSSGSSSCAAGAVAKKLGLVGNKIQVNMPGGNIELEFDESFHVHMKGPVNHVAEGDLATDF